MWQSWHPCYVLVTYPSPAHTGTGMSRVTVWSPTPVPVCQPVPANPHGFSNPCPSLSDIHSRPVVASCQWWHYNACWKGNCPIPPSSCRMLVFWCILSQAVRAQKSFSFTSPIICKSFYFFRLRCLCRLWTVGILSCLLAAFLAACPLYSLTSLQTSWSPHITFTSSVSSSNLKKKNFFKTTF